jgi:membrane-associated phospholipid phosphatase
MSIDDKRRYAAGGFLALIALSVSWPSPVVSINRLWPNRQLAVDELSFLGREALPWDVVFWCIAGLFAITIWLSGEGGRQTLSSAAALFRDRNGRPSSLSSTWIALPASAVVVALTWLFADLPMLRFAELIQSDATESVVRILNRLGGGWNPPMLVFFFALAGFAYGRSRWVWYAAAMAMAGLGAGAVAHLLKLSVGRTRPELWLGAFHYARGNANSFPSGHTVGAFALAGVLLFASPSIPARAIAIVTASAIGLSRILAFRHWASDVVASAFLGLIFAWIATRLHPRSSRSPGASSPPLPSSRRRGRRPPPSSSASA